MLESRALKSPVHTPRRSRLSPPSRLTWRDTEEATKHNVPSLQRWQSPVLIINNPHTTHSTIALFIVFPPERLKNRIQTASRWPTGRISGHILRTAHIEDHNCPDLSKAAYYDSQAWHSEHFRRSFWIPPRAPSGPLSTSKRILRRARRAEHLSVVSKKLGAPVRRLARRRVGARTRRSQVPASALPIGPHARGPVGNFWWLLVVTVGVGRAASNLPSGRDGKGGDSVSCFREPHPAGLALILLLYPPAAPPFSAYH